MRAGARAPGQAGAEAGLSGRVRLPGAKPQTHASHPSPPGSFAAVAPQVHKLPRARQPTVRMALSC